tara:strand:- start:3243 stop:3524 length:282 start_codon:yes stop_codon:yes gene_type:complete
MLLNLFIPIIVSVCNQTNQSTYIIPSADICIQNYEGNEDSYFFGPSNSTNYLLIEKKCRFAEGREKYCKIKDSHFGGLRDSGDFKDYYQVECG